MVQYIILLGVGNMIIVADARHFIGLRTGKSSVGRRKMCIAEGTAGFGQCVW